MQHIDLFSGIGGFAYAIDQIFYEEKIKHTFVDNDKFCQEVLRKHWPEAEIHGDIRKFITYSKSRIKRELAMERKQNKKINSSFQTDILTGGFPCQPFSHAGRRKGTADNRYLWPKMLTCIKIFQPRWIIAENVRGLVTWNEGMVLEQVCADLESEGYEVQPFIIPAVAVNAPHRRDRIWIIANRGSKGLSQYARRKLTKVSKPVKSSARGKFGGTFAASEWRKDWPEVASELCRVDDGIPKRLDRASRLKALGNAIVPQVVMEILRCIK